MWMGRAESVRTAYKIIRATGWQQEQKERRMKRVKQGMWKQVMARDEGSRHLWKALMRRYCLERHCRLRKLFLRGNNYVTSREYTRLLSNTVKFNHCYSYTIFFTVYLTPSRSSGCHDARVKCKKIFVRTEWC